MIIDIGGIHEEVNYFSQKGVEPSLDPWIYDEWKEKEEALSLRFCSFTSDDESIFREKKELLCAGAHRRQICDVV